MNLLLAPLIVRPRRCLNLLAGVAAILAGCTAGPSPPPSPPRLTPPAPAPITMSARPPPAPDPKVSSATSARAYRLDAANHLYEKNASRVYKGKLPPLLYAVGVLQVDIDAKGRVIRTHWLRAPKHAPEVIAEIEKTVHQAEPYPAPVRLGRVTYTETWLWNKSGLFQLHTLTEGQL